MCLDRGWEDEVLGRERVWAGEEEDDRSFHCDCARQVFAALLLCMYYVVVPRVLSIFPHPLCSGVFVVSWLMKHVVRMARMTRRSWPFLYGLQTKLLFPDVSWFPHADSRLPIVVLVVAVMREL